ncbi:hypothetical protein ACFOET_11720 [Parapedobacter deserti]|uniref:Uncharacterized protein n=1 Tax=Parapedobacter deserti TaxID=1912957 RepID=A0ABV7JN55_9SPHI
MDRWYAAFRLLSPHPALQQPAYHEAHRGADGRQHGGLQHVVAAQLREHAQQRAARGADAQLMVSLNHRLPPAFLPRLPPLPAHPVPAPRTWPRSPPWAAALPVHQLLFGDRPPLVYPWQAAHVIDAAPVGAYQFPTFPENPPWIPLLKLPIILHIKFSILCLLPESAGQLAFVTPFRTGTVPFPEANIGCEKPRGKTVAGIGRR